VSEDVLHGIGEDPDDKPLLSRGRALWLLVALFGASALVAIFMGVVGGSSAPKHLATPPSYNGPLVTSHSPSIANDITTTISVPPPSLPRHTGGINPFGSSAGSEDVVAAVNALRAEHHLAAVTGGVSVGATVCAQEQGRGSACEPHFIYASVPSKVGTLGVQRIQTFNSTWLLDPTTTRIEFGWAQGGAQYYLAILKWP
jgi:hypothetical protein